MSYDYSIGKYEITAGQYTEFLNAVATISDPYGLYNDRMDYNRVLTMGCNIQRILNAGSYSYSVSSDWANRPVNFVSWGDTVRFVNWLSNGQPTGALTGDPARDAGLTEDGSYYLNGAMSGSALMAVTRKANATWVIPSEDEWYKAAYNKNNGVTADYFEYPTSSDTMPSNKLAEPNDPGNNATFYDYNSGGYTIGSPYYRTEVGAHENSDSPYGTFDQGGNVKEWNETAVNDSSRGMRGGWYMSYSAGLTASFRDYAEPSDEWQYIGFRVAMVPEPGSITLLVCGAITGLIWRRRRKRNPLS